MRSRFVGWRACFVFVLAVVCRCHAVEIVTQPSFVSAINAPLAGTLLLATDQDSRVSVLVSDATNVWEKDFYSFSTNHALPLLGFKPGETNEILVTVFGHDRSMAVAAQWLPQTRDVLVTYGYVSYVNGVHPSAYSPKATLARLIEYTHDPIPQTVFDLTVFDPANTSTNYQGYLVYRARRIPELYAHPAAPVADLTVTEENQLPRLEFTADPRHNYLVQASTDFQTWTTLGTPVPDEAAGSYYFVDLSASQFAARYYRVITQ